MMELASFQPDIPQNLGGLIRLCACLGVKIDIIEPCGFPLGDRGLKRVAMDYFNSSNIIRWKNWAEFKKFKKNQNRLVLLSTNANINYHEFEFSPSDCFIVGRESSGVPDKVREASDAIIRIPISINYRSLNVVSAAAIVLAEAIRQTNNF
ncbi:tRNA (cytidine(34)-2'-O)-methyltransferase [Alphaproteobacteria bacterium]|nr:tRNA (cytidine(34)-2'-O)-methyltransferase [Alphaproteobacteria bacterium]|tara:strand:- start:16 stop:468 length:453 start_codon:yes stop_codon:yes gene_type:complete